VLIVLKSGSLSLLEPSGPVQACNGIALPLPLLLHTPTPRLYTGSREVHLILISTGTKKQLPLKNSLTFLKNGQLARNIKRIRSILIYKSQQDAQVAEFIFV